MAVGMFMNKASLFSKNTNNSDLLILKLISTQQASI